jgi:hypothetical protein
LKPRAIESKASGSVSLVIEFQGGEQAVFGARTYLLLTRLGEGKVDPRCFPQKLLVGIVDARVRAASRSEYAFQDRKVELKVETSKDKCFRLVRYDGEVNVTR